MKRVRRRKQCHHSKKEDRLSDLPDCVLLRILSFLDTKPAIQTYILSKRWKNIWKCLTDLTLISSNFRNANGFTEFVSHVFSLRDTLTSLHTLKFDSSEIMIKPPLLKRMINYAVSHNVQQLDISVTCDIEYVPPRLFSCQTLTFLDLSVYSPGFYGMRTVFPTSLNLPALVSLSLRAFTFRVGDDGCAEPFSTLSKLKSLIINNCLVLSRHNPKLCISSTTLVNLTIIMSVYRHDNYDLNFRTELSTPSLRTFNFRGTPIQKLCGSKSNLSNIKHVNIDVDWWSHTTDTPLVLLQWLVELANIKSLTVTSTTLKVLSLAPNLLKVELLSLYNLKSLRVEKDLRPSLPDGIVDFLIQNSPLAKVDIVD